MDFRKNTLLGVTILFILIAPIVIFVSPHNIFASLHLLAAITGLFLLFLVSLNLESKSRIFFALAILFSVFWSITHFKAMTLPQDAIWGAKAFFSLDMVFITFTSTFIGLFTFYFDKEKIPVLSALICLLPLVLNPFLFLFDMVGAEYVLGYGWDAVQNMIFLIPYLTMVAIPAVYGLYNLYNIRKAVEGANRQNITLLMVGLLLALFVAEAIDGFLHPFLNFPSLGSIGIIIGLLVMCVPYMRELMK